MTPHEQAAKLLAEALAVLAGPSAATHTVTATVSVTSWTAERFAAAPDLTRIGVTELAAALGRSRSSVYKLVQRDGLPCRKLPDKTLVFLVGEVRRWFAEREQVVSPFVSRLTTSKRSA